MAVKAQLGGWQQNFLQRSRELSEQPPQTHTASAHYAWRYVTSNFGCVPAVNPLVTDIDEGRTVASEIGLPSAASFDPKRAPKAPHGKRLPRPVNVGRSVGIG